MKLKTLFVCLIGLLFLVPLSTPSQAMVDVVCFGDYFVRGTGAPVTESRTFPGISGPATIKLYNGGAEDSDTERVSSSTVTVNGTEIFGPSNFNQTVTYLEAMVSLTEGNNTLEVCLKSKPGGTIWIEITQEVDADAAAVIGPPGGTLQTDTGYSIDIPAGALEEDVIISLTSLSEADLPIPLPPNVSSLGAFDIQPNGITFGASVTLTIPIDIPFSPGTPFPILLFNPATNDYEFETEGTLNEDGNSISTQIFHTSKRFIPHVFVDEEEQRALKTHVLEQISTFFEKYKGKSFYDAGFLKLGEIEHIRNKLFDPFFAVFINAEYLECKKSIAEYYEFYKPGWLEDCGEYASYYWFNDLIISTDPSNVDGKTLYHEMMHAIFDENPLLLHSAGVTNDEAITYYMEDADRYIEQYLVPIDEKLRNGLSCDTESISNDFDMFIYWLNYLLENPNEGSPITPVALYLVERLTGFDVNPATIQEKHITDCDIDGILCTSIEDCDDNCPILYNPLQEDEDEDGVGDACEPSPQVAAFQITPTTLNDGDSLTASYEVTDNQGLASVELWRAPDETGTPGTWEQLATEPVSGITASGNFTDVPSTGAWWYGIHVVDTDNHCTTEKNEDCTSGLSNGGPVLGPILVAVNIGPQIPLPPTGLSATYDSANDWNHITWNEVSNADTYHLYWGTDPSVTKESEYGGDTNGETEFTHTGVVPGWTYYYKVCAENTAGESDLSEEVSVEVPQEDFPVDFPDPVLESAIRAEINKPAPDLIMYSDLQNILYFEFWSMAERIENIYGLQYCTNLESLRLVGHEIVDLNPLSGLSNLTYLILSSNQIADLSPLSGLSNLTVLSINFNQITDLSPLSGLSNLTVLRLGQNQITDLSPLSGPSNLTELGLGENQIADLSPLSGLSNLKILWLQYNQIADLNPLSGLNSLNELYLYRNQIVDISPLSGLSNLKELRLFENQIADLNPLSGLNSLNELYLYSNQITDLSPLSGLSNLIVLSLSANQIVDISPLSGLNNLTELGLGTNQIVDISPLLDNTGIRFVHVNNNPLSATSCNVYIPELQSRGVMVSHSCPVIQPQISSTSGQIGDTLYQPGWGFWPGGTAELHFRRPDETLSPTTTETVQADGTYDHYWTITPDAQLGTYQYWAVDLSSGLTSPEVNYEIWE